MIDRGQLSRGYATGIAAVHSASWSPSSLHLAATGNIRKVQVLRIFRPVPTTIVAQPAPPRPPEPGPPPGIVGDESATFGSARRPGPRLTYKVTG
jgi:hypothetical protein